MKGSSGERPGGQQHASGSCTQAGSGPSGSSRDRMSPGADGKRPKTRKDPATNGLSEVEVTLLRRNPCLAQIPLLTLKMAENGSLPAVTAHIAKHWPSDFCWSACFEPNFLAALMYEGYLPTAHGPVEGPTEYILLPKLHQERCIVHFEDLRVSKSARADSRGYQVAVDTAFDDVVDKCLMQHGESWLHPPIVDSFKRLFRSGGTGRVKMHSIEVKREGQLVAGELGYSVGRTYCSLSGFTAISGSGSVQCLGLALLLHERGFDFWDLGMGMEYKAQMGAREISREDFLRKLRASRDLPGADLSLSSIDASHLLVPRFRIGSYVRVCSAHAVLGGKVGIVRGYAGAHFRVQLEDCVDVKERVILPGQQLEDVCTPDDMRHDEHQEEDGKVGVRSVAGLPPLFRRAPGWTRSRRQLRQNRLGQSVDSQTGVRAVADAREEEAYMQVESSAAHAAPDDHISSGRLRGGSGELEASAGAGSAGARQVASKSALRAEGKSTEAEKDQERWNVKKGHHVGWNVAASRRRQMRFFLLQGVCVCVRATEMEDGVRWRATPAACF